MDDMMKAVGEYLENNEKIIERMHRKGLMQDIDAEEYEDACPSIVEGERNSLRPTN